MPKPNEDSNMSRVPNFNDVIMEQRKATIETLRQEKAVTNSQAMGPPAA